MEKFWQGSRFGTADFLYFLEMASVASRSKSDMKKKGLDGAGSLVLGCNFECGNLGSYKMINNNEYEISIRPDTNNPKHRLWFYYSVSNAKADQRIIFHITNFSKTKSLYREGMSPLIRSKKRPEWQRIPERNVFYYRSQQHKKNYFD